MPATTSNPVMFRGSKRCTRCLQRWPLSEFRKERQCRGGRHAECRQCHNERERVRDAVKRRSALAKFLQDRMQRMTDSKSQRKLLALVDDLTQVFGGTERLATEFRSLYDESIERSDLRTAARVLLAIERLCGQCSSLEVPDVETSLAAVNAPAALSEPEPSQPTGRDISQLTDRQLATRHRKLKR